MPDSPFEFATGAILEPPSHEDYQVEAVLAAGVELPRQFIIPAYRHWFDVDFNVLPKQVSGVYNQKRLPSCVAQATARLKSVQEGMDASPRDIYRIAKQIDGLNDPLGFGTTLAAGQEALVKGAATSDVVPENADLSLAEYISTGDVTETVVHDREANRGKSYYFVTRDLIKQTAYQTHNPVVTSCQWYDTDNGIGADGMMEMPAGRNVGGHAFACIGWVLRGGRECLVMVNSWSEDWGCSGMFFVPTDGVINRLGNGYVAVDIPKDVGKLLQKYNGKNVMAKGSPALWRIDGGKRRHYPDEIVWWAFGNLFGVNVYDIRPDELESIPEGEPMSIDGAPFATRELVRQIRQHYGHA